MIDPAQSFSNALGQGLGIMKSFRDEARQDEDRAFAKQQALFDQNMKERQFALLQRGDDREQARFNEDMAPERVALRGQKAKADADLSTAQARDAGVLADNRKRMIDTDISVSLSNARSNRISAGAAALNARTNAGELGLKQQMYRDQRNDAAYQRSMQGAFAALAQASRTGDFTSITNNKHVAGAVFQMAGAVTQSKAVQEALQNPYGDWIKDPKKFADVANYARVAPVFTATVQKYGFGRDTKVTGFQHAVVKGPDGKPTSVVEMTLTGTRDGKKQTMKFNARPEQLFEPAAMASNIFGRIGRDPQSKARLAMAYGAADEQGFNTILNNEITMLEKQAKLLEGAKVGPQRQQYMAIQDRLQKLYAGDPLTAGELVFNRLGQIATR